VISWIRLLIFRFRVFVVQEVCSRHVRNKDLRKGLGGKVGI
jgi:hypothetical protein